jgi:hypothetical protein
MSSTCRRQWLALKWQFIQNVQPEPLQYHPRLPNSTCQLVEDAFLANSFLTAALHFLLKFLSNIQYSIIYRAVNLEERIQV